MTDHLAAEVETLTIRIPMRLQRRGGRKLIITPDGAALPQRKPARDNTLIRALVKAHRWRRRIDSGSRLSKKSSTISAFVVPNSRCEHAYSWHTTVCSTTWTHHRLHRVEIPAGGAGRKGDKHARPRHHFCFLYLAGQIHRLGAYHRGHIGRFVGRPDGKEVLFVARKSAWSLAGCGSGRVGRG